MKSADLVKSFCNGERLATLSIQSGLPRPILREELIAAMGTEEYHRQTRANGGLAVAAKLKNASYRKKYSTKMRQSVSESIRRYMQNKKFRARWINKAKIASKKGVETIRTRLETDSYFRSNWSGKCRKGGNTSATTKKGMFAANQAERRIWSLKGLNRTGRKCVGPNGEKMYNELEVRVARALNSAGITYEYERIITAPNRNGFYSIDFFIQQGKTIFVEVTCWDDVAEKSKELEKKFEYLLKHFPTAKLALIVKERDREAYKHLLNRSIYILTSAQLICLVQEAKHTPS